MTAAVAFPETQPDNYQWFADEPVFDPARHLALTEPADVVTLSDLGYQSSDVDGKATSLGISEPFRMLSGEGAEVMLAVARRLRSFCRPAGDRIENTVRGGVYRSRWLRDLCLSPEVAEHLGGIYGTAVAPHPMGLHLGHINYEPSTIDTAVDKWHHDTLPLDYVMTVTDPSTTPGGRFEYFVGTKDDARELKARGEMPAADRIVAPDLPGPGWVVALHGNMVVHRGGPLTETAERITMVNGYVATNTATDMQSRNADLRVVDDPDVLFYEWTRFAAWRAKSRLDALIDSVGFGVSAEEAASMLERAVEDVATAIDELRTEEVVIEHYE